MKRLIIIRHAKSSWNEPIPDKNRAISNRGRKDIQLVAKEFQKEFVFPNPVLFCSTAKRARETALFFAIINDYPMELIIYKDELYTFNDAQLEKEIKKFENRYKNVILFGHNEAITNFVNKFGTISISNIPTSGLVSIEFDCDNWSEIKNGVTKKMVFPRDLKL